MLDRYFEALRSHDWDKLSDCLSEDVRRTGPYLDAVRGREAYLSFLRRVLPTLPNHRLEISRTRRLEDGSALVELSETVDLNGVATEFPEALLFEFDGEGRIRTIDIYLKDPRGAQAR
jgi:hypothetical protein